MEKYQGAEIAGVAAYEILDEAIILKFNDGRSYLYDYVRPGKEHVERMKKLAVEGSGLTTYVNKFVRDRYNSVKDYYGKLPNAFSDGLEYQKKMRNEWH